MIVNWKKNRENNNVLTFAATGITLWNSLPPDVRQSGLPYGQFRRSLKTFGQWDHGAVWTLSTAMCRNILTYLLTYLLAYLVARLSLVINQYCCKTVWYGIGNVVLLKAVNYDVYNVNNSPLRDCILANSVSKALTLLISSSATFTNTEAMDNNC